MNFADIHPDPLIAREVVIEELEGRLTEARAGLYRALDFNTVNPHGLAIKRDVRSVLLRTARPSSCVSRANAATPHPQENKMNKFWMVYSPQGGPPTVEHTRRVSADREAERLARANPGKKFVVLSALDVFEIETSPVKRTALEEAPF